MKYMRKLSWRKRKRKINRRRMMTLIVVKVVKEGLIVISIVNIIDPKLMNH